VRCWGIQQLQGADDVGAEDLDGAFDAGIARAAMP